MSKHCLKECHLGHRHSIFCVLPPHLLKNITEAEKSSDEQRRAAMRTRNLDGTFRSQRMTALAARMAVPRGLATQPAVTRSKALFIYTAGNQQTLPGQLVRSLGQARSGDAAVDEAYDGLNATYDFYDQVFERNSIDDEGMPLTATVHFGDAYNNAFWNSVQMVFGDGDGQLFNRFTISLDVIGHELTHGVTEDEARLVYFGQSGALNESMSDVFGSLIRQKVSGQAADQADWLIGAGLLVKEGIEEGAVRDALRSMSNPGSAYNDPILGKDPQPGHMNDFVDTFEDNGGVHINSGIPNRAFYLVATRLGGYAWETAGHIWYESLRDPSLRPDASFSQFARITATIARQRFGSGSAEHQAVTDAWDAVGVSLS